MQNGPFLVSHYCKLSVNVINVKKIHMYVIFNKFIRPNEYKYQIPYIIKHLVSLFSLTDSYVFRIVLATMYK